MGNLGTSALEQLRFVSLPNRYDVNLVYKANHIYDFSLRDRKGAYGNDRRVSVRLLRRVQHHVYRSERRLRAVLYRRLSSLLSTQYLVHYRGSG